MIPGSERLQVRFRQAAVAAGAVAAAVGVTVLIGGWWLDLNGVRQPLAAYPAMRAVTALGLALAGLGIVSSGVRRRRAWPPTMAGVCVLAIGAVTGGAYLAGQPKTWLESVAALDMARDAAIEGRVAVNTALCFVLAGTSLLLLARHRAPGLRQGLGVAVFLIAYAAVLGYASATVEVAGGLQPGFTAMAPHTAVPMLLLGFAISFVDLDSGWARIFVKPLAGGRILRMALPVLLLLFVMASVLYAVLGQDVGERSGGGIVLALVAVAVITGLILLSTRVEHIDSERMSLATDLEVRLAAQQLDARQATTLLRAQFEAAPNGIALVGMDGRILDINAAGARLFDCEPDAIIGDRLADVVVPEDRMALRQQIDAALVDASARPPVDLRVGQHGGDQIWVRTSFGVMRDEDGVALLLVASLIDVTGRLAAERRLRDSEELLRVVLDGSADLVVRLDPDLRVEYVNQRVVDASGVPAAEWIGCTFREMGIPPELVDLWDERHRSVFATGAEVSYDFEIDNRDGHRWYESRVAPVLTADGAVTHVVVASRDVTTRKQAEADLVRLATHDPLTQLANRAELSEELARALSAGHRSGHATAAVMIDLDHFKYVNDSLGHRVGDDLLKLVAERLSATVRGGDLVGRLGGDEFLIVMRDLEDPGEAVRLGWRIVSAFRAPFRLEGRDLYTTATVGVAVADDDQAGPDDLIREADTAMYVAKAEGRDRVAVFNEDLAVAVTARLELEGQLRGALAAGQFELRYQPEVELRTGRVLAVEALLRWRQTDGELLTADRFIEVAEEAGLITDIGRWVLHQACVDGARWCTIRPDRPLIVRVNVSAHQLAGPDLLRALDEALDHSGFDPSLMCVEVTETALLRKTAVVDENFAGIRDRGIRIALDDFGTGYASLAYLRDHTVDVVKIDRSFVAGVASSEQSRRLVAGILAFAVSLGIDVTAEGIETEAQAAYLRDAGCPSGQGFLFARALPADEVDPLLGEDVAVSWALAP